MDSISHGIDEARRREFESAWVDGKPDLERYLPDRDDVRYRGTLEELVLIDLEFRWKDRKPTSKGAAAPLPLEGICLESYLSRFDALRESATLKRLVIAEHELRCRFGTRPVPGDYQRRFPQLLPSIHDEQSLLSVATIAQSAGVNSGHTLGRYQLLRLHARGGFGEIWRAYDPVLNRHVAIKTLSRSLNEDPQIRRRFEAEARTTAQLEHPGIVSVHDSNGVESAVPYYVMRMLEGDTLADAIQTYHLATTREERAVLRMRLLRSFLTVAQTVEFAHAQGVLHRDLKPQNIILGEFGETAILDWGIAKQRPAAVDSPHDSDCPSLEMHVHANEPTETLLPSRPSRDTDLGMAADATVLGTVMGTPAYMSPEQAAGRTDLVDELSDQYCLGVILHEILTGQRPHRADDGFGDRDPRAVPAAAASEIPKPLLAISLKATSNDRGERYGSVSEFQQDLERFLADEPVLAYPEPFLRKLVRWLKRHRTLVSTAATTLVVAAMLLTTGILLLLDANRRLAARESEAQGLRKKTEEALDDAKRNLYGNFVSLAHAELLKNNVVRANQLLDECPAGLRNWEWHHLKSLIQEDQPAFRLTGLGYSVPEIVFSPDGTLLAAAGMDGRILVWNVRGQTRVAELAHGAQVRCIAFSPDGRRLASAGSVKEDEQFRGVVAIWELPAGTMISRAEFHDRYASTLAYSSDGTKLFTGGDDGQLAIWDANTLVQYRTFPAHKHNVEHLVVRPSASIEESALLISCDRNGQLKLWNPDSGTELATVQAHAGMISDCELNASGRRLATAGADRLIKVWDLDQLVKVGSEPNGASASAPAQILAGHTDQVRCVAFSPDGRQLASGGLDRTVRVWDVMRGECVREIHSHTSHVQCVAFDPAGALLASSGDDGDVQVRSHGELVRDAPVGRFVRFAPKGRRLAAASKTRIVFWEDGREVAERRTLRGEFLSAAFSHDGKLFAVMERDEGWLILDARTGNIVVRANEKVPASHCLVFSEDSSKIFSAHVDRKIRIWDARNGGLIQARELPQIPYRIVLPAGDQRLIVGFMNGELGLWRMDNWHAEYETPAHDRFLLDMALDPEQSRLATTGLDGYLKIWDWREGTMIRSTKVGASWLNCLLFSPDGRRVVTGSEHTITFWDPQDLREVLSMSLTRCVHEMSFTSDGKLLALAGEDPAIRIWRGELGDSGGPSGVIPSD